MTRDEMIEKMAREIVHTRPNPGGGYDIIWEDALDYAIAALDALGLRATEEWGMDYGDEIDPLGDKEYALKASEEVNATIARGEDAEYAFLNAHKLVRRTILHTVTPWEDVS